MVNLLPYQLEGVAYALERPGTIIADEMGLGKTIQAIGVINADETIEKVVVVCPVGLKLNWWNELERWLLRKGVLVNVIGYTETHRIASMPFDLLIVDEAHYVKTPTAQRTIEVKRIRKLARKVILLTGTPIENRVWELWPLLQIANPEYWDPQRPMPSKTFLRPLPPSVVMRSLGPSKPKKERSVSDTNFLKFKMRYCGPVKKFYKKAGRTRTAYEFKGGSNLGELNRRLRESCMIRRLKKDVLAELPPKRRQIVVLPSKLSEDDHAPLLLGIVSDYSAAITVANYDDIVHKLHTNKVAFAEWSRMRHAQGVEKVPMVVDHVEDILEQVGKVLVFCHHEDVALDLKLIIPHSVMVTGQTPTWERDAAVRKFQEDPHTRVFIGSIRAAGVGFTLTAADVVLFAEIDPNPAAMRQAEDRAHRIGRRDMVLVQYLVSDRSIDARLCQILTQKLDVSTAALDPESSNQ